MHIFCLFLFESIQLWWNWKCSCPFYVNLCIFAVFTVRLCRTWVFGRFWSFLKFCANFLNYLSFANSQNKLQISVCLNMKVAESRCLVFCIICTFAWFMRIMGGRSLLFNLISLMDVERVQRRHTYLRCFIWFPLNFSTGSSSTIPNRRCCLRLFFKPQVFLTKFSKLNFKCKTYIQL